MKNYAIAGFIAAQSIVAAQPAAAARFEEMAIARTGTFAGARIRLSLGSRQHEQRFRFGLAVAPTLYGHMPSGETRTRIGEGLEIGYTGDRALAFSIGGRLAKRILPGGHKPEDDERQGTSTFGKVAIGVGAVALVTGAIVLGVAISHADDAPDDS